MPRTDLLVDVGAPVCQLAIRDAFEQLEDEEKLYAHWMRERPGRANHNASGIARVGEYCRTDIRAC